MKERGQKNMLFGALWCAGGLLLTVITFGAAQSGGHFIIFRGAILWGAIQFIWGLGQFTYAYFKHSPSKLGSSARNLRKDSDNAGNAIPKPIVEIDSERYWADALTEFEGADRRPGLWARVFAEANGDEAIAKASYLKIRAAELFVTAQQAERELQERARLARLTEEQRAYELLPKGTCPNCGAVIPLNSERCPKCDAGFTAVDGWRIVPLKI